MIRNEVESMVPSHDAQRIIGALDARPMSRFHWKVVILSGIGWAFDGMDTLLLSLALPVLIALWQLTPDQAGLIGTVDRLGALFGAMLAGILADHHGRSLIFQASLLVYSVGTGLLAFVGNVGSFMAVRFFVGLGLGAELPVVSTLVSEFVPPQRRGWLITFLTSFWTYGAILAYLIGYLVIPTYGWQVAFLLGAVPALFVFVLRRGVPESPRYHLVRGQLRKAQEALRRTGIDAEVTAAPSKPARLPHLGIAIGAIFTPAYLRRTILVWIIWFCLFFTYYGIFIWLPQLLVTRGFTLVRSLEFVLLMAFCQIPGYLLAGYCADRIGRRWTFVALLLLSAASAGLLGLAQDPAQVFLWGALLNFFNPGALSIAYAYTPEVYGTEVRATGTGWATAFGRAGAAVAPFLVGLLLAGTPGPAGQTVVFALMAAVFLLAAAAMAGLAAETRGRPLESLAASA